MPATMTPEECIDLVTPEADRQPRARGSALPSHDAAAVTLSFDLTTNTPLPVSARGIADNDKHRRSGNARHDSYRPPNLPNLHETPLARRSASPSHDAAAVTLSFDLTANTPPPVNDRHGGNARHDSDRPPNLLHLHQTSEYARLNTSHVLEPVTVPVTNSSSSPRRKKSRSLLCRYRYSGKENLSNNVSFLSSTPVENRKSPWVPVVDVLAEKNPLSHCLSWRELTNFVGPEKFHDI